ncbi:MAG: hypothetical protein J5J00_16030 [Deltaproteobacteria bacterium]|nr:hypothetical protein [Deltaproteobacteria bacterium]
MPALENLSISAASPSLWGKLRRTFRPAEVSIVAAAFDFAVQHGALDERNIERPSEASFNPRPARVAEIVLSGNHDVTSLQVAAAILLCAEELPSKSLPAELEEAYQTCAAARRSLSDNSPPPDELTASLLLAYMLDDVRHFHMKRDFLAQLDKELPQFESRWRSYSALAPRSKVSALTAHAIERLKRFREDPRHE